jgi:DNA-binding LacI/PurR family transcriptional regulator
LGHEGQFVSERRATINDVALRAQVSRTAVSFALNNPSRLSEGTLRRILAAADELGFVRDPAARMLRTRKTNSIGVLLPQQVDAVLEDPYYTHFFRGIGHVCHREGLSLLLVPPLKDSMLKAIPYAAADGFVVCGLETDRGEVQTLRGRGVPFILVDGDPDDEVPTSGLDDRRGMRDVTNYMLDLGHRRILILAFESGLPGGPDNWHGPLARRWAGVLQGLSDRGLHAGDVDLRVAPNTRAGGADALRAAWSTGTRPTAVIAFSDIIAFGVLDAARQLRIEVPAELSVSGFDDVPEAARAIPALTTVHQPIETKGRLAAEYLIEAGASGGNAGYSQQLRSTIVARASVAPAPGP